MEVTKTLLLAGYYGANNVGDEAILHSLLNDLRSYDPGLHFIVISKDPEKTSAEHAVESVYWEDINAIIDAARRCDLMILGGGGIFHDYWGIDPDKYLRRGFWDITAFGSIPLLANLLNIPCVISAAGVGPFKSELGREHTRLAFERCRLAIIRDNESMEYLRQTGIQLENPDSPKVSVAPDIVFRFESSSSDRYDTEEFLEENFSIGKNVPLLGISLRYWEAEASLKERLSSIAQAVRQFLEKNPRVHIITIPFQVLNATPHTDDSIVLGELAGIVDLPDRVHQINTPIKPQLAQALIGRCTAILGMRFHSVVMSINTGTPIVAISYAPKVQSVMKSVGLTEYCNLSLAPNSNELENQLQNVWDRNLELRPVLLAARDGFRMEAKAHTQKVMDFLNRTGAPPPLQFAQEFALKQTRLLYDADKEILHLRQELQSKSQLLTEIETSRFWKLAKAYYRLAQTRVFVHIREILNARHDKRTDENPKKSQNGIAAQPNAGGKLFSAIPSPAGNIVDTEGDLEKMIQIMGRRPLRGMFIMGTKAFFDEVHVQRVANLSRVLSQKNWAVICISEEGRNELLRREMISGTYENVFHMSLDLFLSKLDILQSLHAKRYFVIESPHPNLFLPMLALRSRGFDLIYDVTSEWSNEESTWYDKEMEPSFVINANFVTAASQTLLKKFSSLRQDIILIPNGYDPSTLGAKHLNPRRRRSSQSSIQLGYMGYLASASPDWEFLSSLLTLAETRKVKIQIHLIDQDEHELKTRLKNHDDQFIFHGPIHPRRLANYAKKWDAAFIDLKEEKTGEPALTRLYEYLHLGLPVLVRGGEQKLEMPFTTFISTPAQALDVLLDIQRNGLKRFEKDRSKLEDVLLKANWEQRFTNLLNSLETSQWKSL